MGATVVFDLDKVLLGGDASTLFLHGRLRQAPKRLFPLLLAMPLLAILAASSRLRPLGARLMTRIAIGGRGEDDVRDVADAIAAVRAHQERGDLVVVATGCEETLARGFLAAIGLGGLDTVGSRAVPPRHALGESKVSMLTERGYPPPWAAVYSDSASDLPLFSGTPRPVLVNAGEKAAKKLERTLGRRPETKTWR